jgi:hypothetical protein
MRNLLKRAFIPGHLETAGNTTHQSERLGAHMKDRKKAAALAGPGRGFGQGIMRVGLYAQGSAHDQVELICVRQFPPPFGPNA